MGEDKRAESSRVFHVSEHFDQIEDVAGEHGICVECRKQLEDGREDCWTHGLRTDSVRTSELRQRFDRDSDCLRIALLHQVDDLGRKGLDDVQALVWVGLHQLDLPQVGQ